MTKLHWRRIIAIATVSLLASKNVLAQTSQWPRPLPGASVSEARSSHFRLSNVNTKSSASIIHYDLNDAVLNEVVRLPPVDSPMLHAATPEGTNLQNGVLSFSRHENHGVDGTWSEDGKYLVINLNGQQLRLFKTNSQPAIDSALPENSVGKDSSGGVNGRLSHHGQPLVNCEVTLVPLRKSWIGYTLDHSEELKTNTDGNGVYHLGNVPSGAYKLKWRPTGESSWIRRAEIRPDVRVRAGETSEVQEIRVALRTIN